MFHQVQLFSFVFKPLSTAHASDHTLVSQLTSVTSTIQLSYFLNLLAAYIQQDNQYATTTETILQSCSMSIYVSGQWTKLD